MYSLPSLVKTAYYACNKAERNEFDLAEAPDVDLRYCCESLFEFLKVNKNLDEGDGRQTMYSRSQFAVVDKKFKYVCEEAALHRHIDCLKLAHEIGLPWNDMTCSNAALNGHLKCLKYAGMHGCPMSFNACSNGHLKCLKYLRRTRCPWNQATCSNAALNGHLDCLIYARKHRCRWNHATCSNGALNGHL